MFTIPYAELYYKVGQPEKANKILMRITQIYSQNLDFYYSSTGRVREYYSKDVEMALGILRRMNTLATEYRQDKLADEINVAFKNELKKFQ
jgi:siroheme synthase (precorrin-2 oxidase/ferrochelatase)